MRELNYVNAGLEAVAEEMREDPKIIYFCTDAPGPLVREFGVERVRATPIAESAMTGMAIGAAGCGYRPIVDWRLVTFSFVAMDQVVNQAAKIHYMFGGQANFPIVFRTVIGGGTRRAAQHSQSPYSMFMNLAGLKMIIPSTPRDLMGLLKTAIRDNNPVVSFECGRIAGMNEALSDDIAPIPLGKADIKRGGSDVTIVALAWMVPEALAAAQTLSEEGISAEVIDTMNLVPIDNHTILTSVQKTGRLVVADEACPTAGAAAEIAALVTEDSATFRALKGPIKRICALNVPIPYSPALEDHVFPDRNRIAQGVRDLMDTTNNG